MKKAGINVEKYMGDFTVDYFSIDVGAVQDTYRYLMNINNIK